MLSRAPYQEFDTYMYGICVLWNVTFFFFLQGTGFEKMDCLSELHVT